MIFENRERPLEFTDPTGLSYSTNDIGSPEDEDAIVYGIDDDDFSSEKGWGYNDEYGQVYHDLSDHPLTGEPTAEPVPEPTPEPAPEPPSPSEPSSQADNASVNSARRAAAIMQMAIARDTQGRSTSGVPWILVEDSTKKQPNNAGDYRIPKTAIQQMIDEISKMSKKKLGLLGELANVLVGAHRAKVDLQTMMCKHGVELSLDYVKAVFDASHGDAQSAAEAFGTTVQYASEILDSYGIYMGWMSDIARIESDISAIDYRIDLLDSVLYKQYQLEVQNE